jgi:hypothetical protein
MSETSRDRVTSLKKKIPQPPGCLIMDSPIFHLTRLQARQVVWFHLLSLQSNHLSEAVELAARNNNNNHSQKYKMAFNIKVNSSFLFRC